jgi:signal transduction histidine kinase
MAMTMRLRLLLGFLVVVAVPLVLFAAGARHEVTRRVTDQYERRAAALAGVARAELERQSEAVAGRLAALAVGLARDTRFRLAAVQRVAAERPYLLDVATDAMRLAGLSYLQIQDTTGRILSSGHFRNEYDRLEPEVPAALARLGSVAAIVRARTPDGPFLAFARLDSLQLGTARFTVVGGLHADTLVQRLVGDPDLRLMLDLPDTLLSFGGSPARADSGGSADALVLDIGEVASVSPLTGTVRMGRARVSYPLEPLRVLRRGVDVWFLPAVAAAGATAVLLALALSALISRPVRALAEAASRIDLDRADVTFASDRRDEIGVLAQLLQTMMGRLRGDAARLREAERRAAIGDVARQVNHDVKNGLTPVRNVFRHLDEVAAEPEKLAAVYAERRGTIESGVAYLERLAGNYARLAPTTGWQPCDVNGLARDVAAGAAADATVVRFEPDDALPALRTDPLALRRVMENLVRNALDSLDGGRGGVRLATEATPNGVRIRVSDTGRGMTREELDRAFEPFYTTKPSGSGLGLPIVRRLVADLGGTFRVTSEPGRGTEAVVEFPVAGTTVPATLPVRR